MKVSLYYLKIETSCSIKKPSTTITTNSPKQANKKPQTRTETIKKNTKKTPNQTTIVLDALKANLIKLQTRFLVLSKARISLVQWTLLWKKVYEMSKGLQKAEQKL